MPWSVYILRVEGSDIPFYVGCTSRTDYRRLVEHNRKRTDNLAKKAIMDAARLDGKMVLSEVVSTHETEDEGFTAEKNLIAHYGRLPDGPLSNLSTGGRENAGVIWTKQSRAKAAAAKIGNKINVGRKRPDMKDRFSKPISAHTLDGKWHSSHASAREAATALNLHFGSISDALNGKKKSSKTKDGLIFQFVFGGSKEDVSPTTYRSQLSRRKS